MERFGIGIHCNDKCVALFLTVPTDCPPGHFIDGETNRCYMCAEGTYQQRASQVN